MTEQPIVMNFQPPGPDTPGYLRRQAKALEYMAMWQDTENPTPEAIYQMADFLAEYFVDVEPERARELVMDASENQFKAMLSAIGGEGEENPTEVDGESDQPSS